MSNKKTKFFEGQEISPKRKEYLSGKNEPIVRSILESLGYRENEHFIWQHIALDGCIVDFAFPNEMIVIEADGGEHKSKRKEDFERDNKLYNAGWVVIRIDTTNLDSYQLSFHRNLIREVVEERKGR